MMWTGAVLSAARSAIKARAGFDFEELRDRIVIGFVTPRSLKKKAKKFFLSPQDIEGIDHVNKSFMPALCLACKHTNGCSVPRL